MVLKNRTVSHTMSRRGFLAIAYNEEMNKETASIDHPAKREAAVFKILDKLVNTCNDSEIAKKMGYVLKYLNDTSQPIIPIRRIHITD